MKGGYVNMIRIKVSILIFVTYFIPSMIFGKTTSLIVKEMRRITSKGYSHALSPDGTKIVADHYIKGGVILKFDSNFKSASVVCNFAPCAQNFVWSPDSTKIVCEIIPAAKRPGYFDWENSNIWVLDVSAEGLVKNKLKLTSQKISDMAWSPDNKKIAFCCDTGLYIVNSDGTEQKMVVKSGDNLSEVAWLPEEKIAFIQGYNKEIKDIFFYDLNTKKITSMKVPKNETFDSKVTHWWFSNKSGVSSKVHYSNFWINWDGTDKTQYNRENDIVFQSWSPDGRYFAYTKGIDVGAEDVIEQYIGIFDTKTKISKRLTFAKHKIFDNVFWFLDGKSLFFSDDDGFLYILLFK